MRLSRSVFPLLAAWFLLVACALATAQQLRDAPTAKSSGQKATPTKPDESKAAESPPPEPSPPAQPAAQVAPQNSAGQSQPPKEKVVIPASAERHYHQAVQYERAGNVGNAMAEYKDAIKEFKEAVRVNPNDAGAHNNLGMAMKRMAI